MVRVLEAVPNFSEGRDLSKVRALVDTIAATGVEVLDWSADPGPSSLRDQLHRGPGPGGSCVDRRGGVCARPHRFARAPGGSPARGGARRDAVGSLARCRYGRTPSMPRTVSGGRSPSSVFQSFYYGYASDSVGRGLAELRRGRVRKPRRWIPQGPSPPSSSVGRTPSCDRRGDVRRRQASPARMEHISARESVVIKPARSLRRSVSETAGFAGVRALGTPSRVAGSRPDLG